jgi:Bacterial SH3 domain
LDPGRGLGQYDWMKVSAEQQGAYVVRSYQYAAQQWPWMAGMLLSNLDASTSPYHAGPEDGLPWFAILNEDHSARPAYEAFKQMRTAVAARPPEAPAAAPAVEPGPATVALRVANTDGAGVALRAEPGLQGRRLAALAEGTVVQLAGPDQEAEGRIWRNVRSGAGQVGWVAGDYLVEAG